jgi:predicted MPP superfamily phosphohydrolase
VIGPLFHSPKRSPRSTPLVPGRGRSVENRITDWVERLSAPFGRWRPARLVTERREIALTALDQAFDGYRLVFLTDLHHSPMVPARWIATATQVALDLAPDLILLGGDFVSHSGRFADGLIPLLRTLAAPDGVFAVLGNHDHYVGAEAVRRALGAAGVVELRNRGVIVERGGAVLGVAGIGDLQYDTVDFPAALGDFGDAVPRIVLSHNPDAFAYLPPGSRCDLMLSGHTHGGQAHLPLLGPPYVPSQFGFRYLAGAFRDGPRQLYVSRGVGAITLPIRWRCPAELTLVVLRPA